MKPVFRNPLVPLFFWALLAHHSPASATPPNVVLVLSDDQGYGDLSCHGNKILKTPNMDRLHDESARLVNFHADPTCSPTRSALMTGRYSHRVGVWHTIGGRELLKGQETTMAEVFSASGYHTAIFGKWHLGDNYPMRPQDQGFQEVLIRRGGGHTQTPDYWGNKGFDETYYHNGAFEKYSGYMTDVQFAEATKYIKKNKDAPFFVYLATNATHAPFLVAKKYSDPYAGKNVEANFYGMIANLDENLGKLMDSLQTFGLADNTILIFMTDNGTTVGGQYNSGMRGMKSSEYEGGHRVPFFIRWKAGGIRTDVSIPNLTAHLDVLPTLISLCGLTPPAGVVFDGTDFSPLLKDPAASFPDRNLVVESQRIEIPAKGRKNAVMNGPWRLVDQSELYNIDSDPGQKNNVAGANSARVAQMKAVYNAYWTDVSKNDGGYTDISLGSEVENPTLLTCHDWHGDKVPVEQTDISNGMVANGFWAVKVEQAGSYEVSLRRWPLELDKPVTDVHARLRVGDPVITGADDVDVNKAVSPGTAPAVVFEVELKAGETKLQTWLTNAQNVTRGAYYVSVKRISPTSILRSFGLAPGFPVPAAKLRQGPAYNAKGRRVLPQGAEGMYFAPVTSQVR